jgi:hypothetical protein
VKPFDLDENYRITADNGETFALERRRRDKKTGAPLATYTPLGYFSDLHFACRAWARRRVLESDLELPQALADAKRRLDATLEAIRVAACAPTLEELQFALPGSPGDA